MRKRKKLIKDSFEKDPKGYSLNKIIYFDRETIKNILQEYNKGTKLSVVNSSDSMSFDVESNIETEAEVKLSIPVWARVKFLFSSKMDARYISKIDETVTITSTELSDFERIKDGFTKFEGITISDIEDSATFFRVAGNYIRILKGGVKEVDVKEFKNVMEGYEGYDHYKIDESTYIRFNSSAFLSNYKRNDLMNSCLSIYCISVGRFTKASFNFFEQLNKMQRLSTVATQQTLADLYPSFNTSEEPTENTDIKETSGEKTVALYDVVYASIVHQEESNANN